MKKRTESILATVCASFDEFSNLYSVEECQKSSDKEFFNNTDAWIS